MNRARTLIRRFNCVLPLLLSLTVLTGCGGGAGLFAGGGIGGTGLSTGAIIAFASVIVNGVEYSTDNAVSPGFVTKKFINGLDNSDLRDNSAFRVGMVVAIHHSRDDNKALEIDFLDNFGGPVGSRNTADNTFTVFGQTVKVDGSTKFYDDAATPPFASFADIGPGNVVVVSGLPDASGVIHATYLDRTRLSPGSGETFEIKGFIGNLTGTTFTIGQIPAAATVMVDYSGVPSGSLPPGGLRNGLFVEVKTPSAAGPTIVAESVEAEDYPFQAAEGDSVSFEGYPSEINGTSQTFRLNGVPVSAAGALYLPVGDFANVTTATKLQVEGTITGGVLHAAKIVFR